MILGLRKNIFFNGRFNLNYLIYFYHSELIFTPKTIFYFILTFTYKVVILQILDHAEPICINNTFSLAFRTILHQFFPTSHTSHWGTILLLDNKGLKKYLQKDAKCRV